MYLRMLSAMVLPLALAQTPAVDAEKRFAELRAGAAQAANKYREDGGKPGGPGDPALKWAEAYWKLCEDYPGTSAATQATRHALAWLRHANQDNEVLARAEKLPATDPAWATAIAGVRDSARKTGEYGRFLRIAQSVLSSSKDAGLRAAVHAAIGQSWLDQHKPEQAKAAFESAIREGPGSAAAKTAEKSLYGITHLAIGKPAPRFAAKTIDGAPISLDDFRGKVIFLNVWATW